MMNIAVGCFCLLMPAFGLADIVISTKNGQVQGHAITTARTGQTIYAFQGIPYAVPPLGELRFQEPIPSAPWDGIWDATSDGSACIASNYNPSSQSEDCLFLNIFVPSLNSSKKYPVMFHIHGGRYIGSSSNFNSYNPSYLVEKDVIVVTHNYRLGPYGFLSTGDLAIPGNAGMKDQVLALKWVNENIEAFGGDASKITVFGQSAGGSACGLQVLSKKSAGLFRAAICQSGSGLSPWSVYRSPQTFAYALANSIDNRVNNQTYNTTELNEFLVKQSASAIINAANDIAELFEKEADRLTPTIEAEHEGAFLTENPYDLMESGDFNQVPLIIGICSEEGLAFVNSVDMAKSEAKKLDSEPEYIYPYDFEAEDPSNEDTIENFIKRIYLEPNQTFGDNLYQVIRFKSDDMFTRGVIKHGEMQSRFANVYFYKFSFDGSLNYGNTNIPGGEGKCPHGADLAYLFTRGANYSSLPDADKLMIDRMTTLWTNFAKYLNPTPEKDEVLGNFIWPKFNDSSFQYVNITINFDVLENPMEETYSKWNEAYYRWNKRPFTTF
ncbi:juvenile hormone esterase-like [Cylas formicarius]|uniref:juvenile hormone esterase-like n=1 Tax=Cylas formicarius TaxID=197179 RepID=UPI002958579A|nr:juvenile hormone esterase-like [Cylas formicarius]